LIEYFKPF